MITNVYETCFDRKNPGLSMKLISSCFDQSVIIPFLQPKHIPLARRVPCEEHVSAGEKVESRITFLPQNTDPSTYPDAISSPTSLI